MVSRRPSNLFRCRSNVFFGPIERALSPLQRVVGPIVGIASPMKRVAAPVEDGSSPIEHVPPLKQAELTHHGESLVFLRSTLSSGHSSRITKSGSIFTISRSVTWPSYSSSSEYSVKDSRCCERSLYRSRWRSDEIYL
jgi:hypothetical protein